MWDVLRINLVSPLTLSFALGVFARIIRSELSLPRELYTSLSIYLLFALGLKGGVELSHSSLDQIAGPALVTVLLGCITPISTYLVLRRIGRFPIADAAGIAAHYGSVSAVTFIAAQQFVSSAGAPAEGFMPTLLTLLEIPGIQIALAIGAIQLARTESGGTSDEQTNRGLGKVLHELLTARSMLLLVGGLVIGAAVGVDGWKPVQPVFEGLFKGLLTLFLLEMGLAAGSRLGDLKKTGLFLVAFGILMRSCMAPWAPGWDHYPACLSADAPYLPQWPPALPTLQLHQPFE